MTPWAAVLLLLPAQILDLPVVTKNPYTAAADLEQGKKLYNGRCAGCHGPAGNGGKGANLAVPSLPRAQTDSRSRTTLASRSGRSPGITLRQAARVHSA